uniref:Zinc finger MYM-type protein 1 n=1 Tax=Sipha flava TaxID=143950 RepID=A0A2S2QRP4_9HEMI
MKAFQMSANSSQKITHFYTNNVVGESSQTSLENPKPDERDQINKNQNEKLELAELEKIHEITTKVKVKESNIDFLKYKNQDAEINENSKEVLVETIEIRQEYHQDITGEIVQKLFANEKIDEVINYFCKPKSIDIVNFFIFHPIQPTNSSLISLPFNEKIFFSDQGDCKFNRKWLTYDENNQKLFCSVCLAYSDESSKFCSGFNDWKHTSQRIKEHEISKHHNSSVKAYIREKREKTVQHLLCGEQLQKRKIEVNERRCVLLQIIEVIKLIGKQGLPFRGDKSEAAYKLDDSSLNHGNFLEIILLLSKSENILKSHIEKSIKLSKEHHDRAQNINMKALKTTTKIGRGNLVTFLSATTVTTIIKLIGKEIKNMISREVKKAKIFSVMMDTTMDLSSYDQCSIVLRYVPHNEVCERLIGLKHVTSTSGNSLFETLKDTLAELDLPLNNCVANAFDGAANMSGHYNGVTAKLSEVITNHVHTWCYAHVLNLVLSDTTQCLTPCMSFFNLVQEAFVFFKEFYKRLAVYHKENPSLKLAASVATRWRSRNDAIVKIFGRIDFWIKGDLSPENESKFAYIQLLVALYEISISNQFNSKIRNDSLSLMKKFCSYETVLVAMMFLQIFKIITPLSDYLQTKHLDYIQAWRHVSSAHKSLQSVRNRFCDITKAAKTFVDFVVKKIDEKELLRDIEIEENLPKKRKRTVKRMDGELTRDEEVSTEEIDQFCIKIFNFTMDTIINSLEGTILSSSDFIYRFRMFRPSKV